MCLFYTINCKSINIVIIYNSKLHKHILNTYFNTLQTSEYNCKVLNLSIATVTDIVGAHRKHPQSKQNKSSEILY